MNFYKGFLNGLAIAVPIWFLLLGLVLWII